MSARFSRRRFLTTAMLVSMAFAEARNARCQETGSANLSQDRILHFAGKRA